MSTQYSGFNSESFFFLWEVISVDKEKTPTVVNEQGVNVKKMKDVKFVQTAKSWLSLSVKVT